MKNFEDFERNHEVKTSTEKQFGFFLGFLLLIFSFFLFYKKGDFSFGLFFMTFVVFLVSFVKPVLFRPFNKAWTKLGFAMARFTNPIILGVFFFLIFTPFSFVFRLFSGSSFVKDSRNVSSTTWIKCEKYPDTSMENQF